MLKKAIAQKFQENLHVLLKISKIFFPLTFVTYSFSITQPRAVYSAGTILMDVFMTCVIINFIIFGGRG